jgi:hypothetical protein
MEHRSNTMKRLAYHLDARGNRDVRHLAQVIAL